MSLFRRLDPKMRRMANRGNLCLVAGLLLFLFARPSGTDANIAVHAVAGLLIGISLGVNICVLRWVRRCRQQERESGTTA
jgi:hypothetical protein